jgi:hypothetical protein
MKHTFGKQTKRAGIVLVAAAAFAALGIGTAQAQQFASASISLNNAGNLQCKWRETGLGALSLVTYDCSAEGVGVVTGCFVKNKFVGPFAVSIVKNVTVEESEPLLAKNNGAINGTIVVEVPEGGGEVQCNEAAGAEPHTVAVRWCQMSLKDVTNNIVGANEFQLTAIIARTGDQVAPLPTCTEILASPGTGGGD